MPLLDLTAADFAGALTRLLPRGPVWPREPDSTVAETMEALAPSFARSNARANFLVEDAFPANTTELLPEWEASLGLPDPCLGEAPTLAARRAEIVARLTGRGGQSRAYMIAYAARLGFTITITEFKAFCAGDPVGSPDNGDAWGFVWQNNAPLNSYTFFLAGSSVAGEPLAEWGNTVLECEMRRIAPEHTILLFAYGP